MERRLSSKIGPLSFLVGGILALDEWLIAFRYREKTGKEHLGPLYAISLSETRAAFYSVTDTSLAPWTMTYKLKYGVVSDPDSPRKVIYALRVPYDIMNIGRSMTSRKRCVNACCQSLAIR